MEKKKLTMSINLLSHQYNTCDFIMHFFTINHLSTFAYMTQIEINKPS
jgi:hypothetical protein